MDQDGEDRSSFSYTAVGVTEFKGGQPGIIRIAR